MEGRRIHRRKRDAAWLRERPAPDIQSECQWTDRVTGERKTSRDQANAARLLQLNRQHSMIENGAFAVRNETFGEDRSASDRGQGRQ